MLIIPKSTHNFAVFPHHCNFFFKLKAVVPFFFFQRIGNAERNAFMRYEDNPGPGEYETTDFNKPEIR